MENRHATKTNLLSKGKLVGNMKSNTDVKIAHIPNSNKIDNVKQTKVIDKFFNQFMLPSVSKKII